MSNIRQRQNSRSDRPEDSRGPTRQTGAQNSAPADDGTREYHLHAHASAAPVPRLPVPGGPDPTAAGEPWGLGALNENVFAGLAGAWLEPELGQTGETPRRSADGSLGEEDSVVRREKERREEFPYG